MVLLVLTLAELMLYKKILQHLQRACKLVMRLLVLIRIKCLLQENTFFITVTMKARQWTLFIKGMVRNLKQQLYQSM